MLPGIAGGAPTLSQLLSYLRLRLLAVAMVAPGTTVTVVVDSMHVHEGVKAGMRGGALKCMWTWLWCLTALKRVCVHTRLVKSHIDDDLMPFLTLPNPITDFIGNAHAGV